MEARRSKRRRIQNRRYFNGETVNSRSTVVQNHDLHNQEDNRIGLNDLLPSSNDFLYEDN